MLIQKDRNGYSALEISTNVGQMSVTEMFLSYFPLKNHLKMYQSALNIAKENNQANCVSVIETALLQHALNDHLSLTDLSKDNTSSVIKQRSRL